MTSNERPLIAVVGELTTGVKPSLLLATRYAAAVERAGGLPLALPPLASRAFLADALARIDGVLFSGGDDFDTERIGLGPCHPAAKPVPAAKQDFDFRLVRELLARGIPTLGICYGMQLLALAEGGGLYQHLPDDRPGAQSHTDSARHGVAVAEGTKLHGLLEVASLTVISRHHQAVSDAPAPWSVSARDDEGLIEAIEHTNHPFALGVQWHPELAEAEGVEERLFHGLVEAARAARGEAFRPTTGVTT